METKVAPQPQALSTLSTLARGVIQADRLFADGAYFAYHLKETLLGVDAYVFVGIHEGSLAAAVADTAVHDVVANMETGVHLGNMGPVLLLEESATNAPFLMGDIVDMCRAVEVCDQAKIDRVLPYINRLVAQKHLSLMELFARHTSAADTLRFDALDTKVIHAAMQFALGVLGENHKTVAVDYLMNLIGGFRPLVFREEGVTMPAVDFYVCRELAAVADLLTATRLWDDAVAIGGSS